MEKRQSKIENQDCRTVEQVVCPVCFRLLPEPTVFHPFRAEGHTWRIYQGWCFSCDRGAIVQQFLGMDGRDWLLCKYKGYDLPGNVPTEDAEWTELIKPWEISDYEKIEEDPPVLKFGPGGEFTRDITDAELGRIIDVNTQIVKQMAEQAQKLLDGVKHLIHVKKHS